MTELKYWLWLTSRPGMDPGRVLLLLDHFVTPERIYYADPEEYALFPLNKRQRRRRRVWSIRTGFWPTVTGWAWRS